MKRILLVDGSNILWRSLHAQNVYNMERGDGLITGPIVAFINTVCRVADQHRISHGVAVFDSPTPSFRALLNGRYKSSREHVMPEGAEEQIPLIRRAVKCLGFSLLDSAPYEADDIIASLATQHDRDFVVVLSDDKDLGALVVGDRVIQHRPRNGGEILNEKAIREKWGVAPSLVADVQALCGDSIDEVKGVHGVGPKYASEAIARYGSFEKYALKAADGKGARWMQRASAIADGIRLISATRMHTDIDVPELAPRRKDWAQRTVNFLLELDAHSTALKIASRNGVAIRGGTAKRASLFG